MLLSSDGKSYDAGRIAGGGLLTALVLVFILISYLSPTADLALMSMASLGIAVAVVRYGFRTAIIVFLASGLISAVWPGIFFSLPFLLIFGPWPLIKAYIENRFKNPTAVIAKQLIATVIFVIAGVLYLLIFSVDPSDITNIDLLANLPKPAFWLAILVIAEIGFYLYDWALTLLITIYMRRLNGRI